MIDFIFTHETADEALNTRDTLHEYLKGSKAYVDNDIILSDGAPTCKSGEMVCTVIGADGKEVKYDHCITLLVGANSEKTENKLYQVIHVYDEELDTKLGTLKTFLKS